MCTSYTSTSSRKPKLAIDMEYMPDNQDAFEKETDWDAEEIIQQAQEMQQLKENIKERVKSNIGQAQEKNKLYYDRKHANPRVREINNYLPKHDIP